jgi:hypothetical protein
VNRNLTRVVLTFLLFALVLVSPAGARPLGPITPPTVSVDADCEQVCVTLNTGTGGNFTLKLYFDGVEVASESGYFPGGTTVVECRTWIELGVDFDPLLTHDVGVVVVEITGATTTFGPCDEPQPPGCATELLAGRHHDAGVVNIWHDAEFLHVQYAPDGWTLGETHLYVGTEPPAKSAPGKFPYSGQDYYMIPLSDFDLGECDTLYIAAHAVVYGPGGRDETAWADTYGVRIPKGGWGLYVQYDLCGGRCLLP